MLRLAISGCTGRMGRALIQVLSQDQNVLLTAALAHPKSPFVGRDLGVIAGVTPRNVKIVGDLNEVINDFDVLIDFTVPEASLNHLSLCQAHNKKIVIGTTGFSPPEKETIKQASKEIPIVFSPNMSVGVNLCFALLKQAAKVLEKDVDIHISEKHHKQKIDAPSGTALEMGAVIKQVSPALVGFSSVRAGDIVGEHTVLFALEGEQIELTHRASNRSNFAVGAVRAAKWLADKPCGLYSMTNVLGFE